MRRTSRIGSITLTKKERIDSRASENLMVVASSPLKDAMAAGKACAREVKMRQVLFIAGDYVSDLLCRLMKMMAMISACSRKIIDLNSKRRQSRSQSRLQLGAVLSGHNRGRGPNNPDPNNPDPSNPDGSQQP